LLPVVLLLLRIELDGVDREDDPAPNDAMQGKCALDGVAGVIHVAVAVGIRIRRIQAAAVGLGLNRSADRTGRRSRSRSDGGEKDLDRTDLSDSRNR